jgi:hypothetical protein
MAETWSCETELAGKSQKQEWIIAGDRMFSPKGKGHLQVAHNDDHVVVGFFRNWDSKTRSSFQVIIEKTTGTYVEMNDIVMNVLGKEFKDTTSLSVDVGQCALTKP